MRHGTIRRIARKVLVTRYDMPIVIRRPTDEIDIAERARNLNVAPGLPRIIRFVPCPGDVS